MQFDRPTIKRRAKELIRQTFPHALVITLLYVLLTSTLGNLVELFSPNPLNQALSYLAAGSVSSATYALQQNSTGLGLFLAILLTLYQSVMGFGYTVWSLHTWQGARAGFSTLLDGFSMVGRILWMQLQIFFRMLGWATVITLAGMLPLLVSSAILANYNLFLSILGALMLVAVIICIGGAVIAVSMRYVLVPFALAQHPEMTATMAVHEGIRLSNHHLWNLFKLELSFLGWQLLLQMAAYLIGFLCLLPSLSSSWYDIYNTLATLSVRSIPFWVTHLIVLVPSSLLTAYMRLTYAGAYQSLSQPLPPQDPAFTQHPDF